MMTKAERNALRRKGEKYVRLAYDLESDAAAIRALGGFPDLADWINSQSSSIGKLGRHMLGVAE